MCVQQALCVCVCACACACVCFWVNEPQRKTQGSVGGQPISSAYCFLFAVHTQGACIPRYAQSHRQVDYSVRVLKKSTVYNDELSSCPGGLEDCPKCSVFKVFTSLFMSQTTI